MRHATLAYQCARRGGRGVVMRNEEPTLGIPQDLEILTAASRPCACLFGQQ